MDAISMNGICRAFAACLLLGCANSGDKNMGNDLTANVLTQWADLLCQLAKVDSESLKKESPSLDDFLEAFYKNKLIQKHEIESLSTDFWGTKFIPVRKREKGDISIMIISCGHNKTFERGEKDDLVLEITLRNGLIDTAELRIVHSDGTASSKDLLVKKAGP